MLGPRVKPPKRGVQAQQYPPSGRLLGDVGKMGPVQYPSRRIVRRRHPHRGRAPAPGGSQVTVHELALGNRNEVNVIGQQVRNVVEGRMDHCHPGVAAAQNPPHDHRAYRRGVDAPDPPLGDRRAILADRAQEARLGSLLQILEVLSPRVGEQLG